MYEASPRIAAQGLKATPRCIRMSAVPSDLGLVWVIGILIKAPDTSPDQAKETRLRRSRGNVVSASFCGRRPAQLEEQRTTQIVNSSFRVWSSHVFVGSILAPLVPYCRRALREGAGLEGSLEIYIYIYNMSIWPWSLGHRVAIQCLGRKGL